MLHNRFHFCVLIAALITYLTAAINGKGYFNYDEHYQIIEFANLKMGVNDPSDLAWEYKARLRPAIQPVICYGLFKTLQAAGITDAYSLALSLRLLTLALSLTAIYLFGQSSLSLIKPSLHKLYLILAYFLWFLPLVNVRFSSETWSGTLFLLGAAMVQHNLSKKNKQSYLTGILFGLSFLCRFQSAFLVLALFLWLIVIHKEPIKSLIRIIFGGLFILILGIFLDYWFYGELVFTPWNYFNVNILQGVASSFGTSPWFNYMGVILYRTIFPIGSLILTSICVLIKKIAF